MSEESIMQDALEKQPLNDNISQNEATLDSDAKKTKSESRIRLWTIALTAILFTVSLYFKHRNASDNCARRSSINEDNLINQKQWPMPNIQQKCPANIPYSCQNTSYIDNKCCFNYPGGMILLTQFWDYSPALGGNETWTLHGLWPDRCDGSFEQFCDASRNVNVEKTLADAGRDDLIDEMNEYWLDFSRVNNDLWTHEWSKHGTCISTLGPECYPSQSETYPVVSYFEQAVSLYKTLPTYEILSKAGIVPSYEASYTTSEIMDAFQAFTGGPAVTFRCDHKGVLNEVWYYYNVQGPLVGGKYQIIAPDGLKTACPLEGIKYLPKGGNHGGIKPPIPSPGPSGPFKGRGFVVPEDQSGCLIGNGHWYVSGTCATYTVEPQTDGFTLRTNKGPCGLQDGPYLTCGKNVAATTFTSTHDDDGYWLTYEGQYTWNSPSGVPTGWRQFPLKPGSGSGVSVRLGWQGL